MEVLQHQPTPPWHSPPGSPHYVPRSRSSTITTHADSTISSVLSSPWRSAINSPIIRTGYGLHIADPPYLSALGSPSLSPHVGIATEAEIQVMPIDDIHKEIAIVHHRRLVRVVAAGDMQTVSCYTTRSTAREQLACMTLAIRDFVDKHDAGEISHEDGEACSHESVIADIVDAAFHVPGNLGMLVFPAFRDPLPPGRDSEIRALVQQSFGSSGADDSKLWTTQGLTSHNRPLPDYCPAFANDIGADIDWNHVIRPYISEDNMVYRNICARFANKAVVAELHKGVRRLEPEQLDERLRAEISENLEGKPRTARQRVNWPSTGRSRAVSEVDKEVEWEVLTGLEILSEEESRAMRLAKLLAETMREEE